MTIDLSNIERTIEVDDWQVNTDISGIGQEPSIPHRINLNNTYTDMSLNALSISTPGTLTNYSYRIDISFDRISPYQASNVTLDTTSQGIYRQTYRVISTEYSQLWKEFTRYIRVDDFIRFTLRVIILTMFNGLIHTQSEELEKLRAKLKQ